MQSQHRCRSKDIPPGNPFSPEEIYRLYDSKSLPPGKDFLGKIFPPRNLFFPSYGPFPTFSQGTLCRGLYVPSTEFLLGRMQSQLHFLWQAFILKFQWT